MGDFLANHLLLPDGIPFKETSSSILGWLNCPLFIYIYIFTLNGNHQIFQNKKTGKYPIHCWLHMIYGPIISHVSMVRHWTYPNVQNCLSIFINYWLVLYPLYPNDIPIQWSGTCDSFGSLKKRLFFLGWPENWCVTRFGNF